MAKGALIFLGIWLWAYTAHAADFKLTWPVACTLGENCWFMNYHDIDPAKGAFKDAACGNRTYDTHNGTDIAIASEAGMMQGFAVLAGADGTVTRLRDGEEDRLKETPEDIETVRAAKKECGNGILIEHAGGYKTQYCHLKKGSLRVKPDDKVIAGQPIAEIGLSGVTQHPHLHISLTGPDGKPLDLFGGAMAGGSCAASSVSYWRDDKIVYHAADIVQLGLTGGKPDYAQVLAGTLPQPKPGDANSILYVVGFGLKAGDMWTLTLTDPAGAALVAEKTSQKTDKARQFYFMGKPVPLVKGVYKLEAKIERNGAKIAEKRGFVTVE